MGKEFDPWVWFWPRSLGFKWLVTSVCIALLIALIVTVRAHSHLHLYTGTAGQVLYREGNLWRPLGVWVWIEAFMAYFVSNFLAWGLILGLGIWLYKTMERASENR